MIPAVARALADILAGNASSIGTDQIDFDHPRVDRGRGSRLNLYCYELRPTEKRLSLTPDRENPKTREEAKKIVWFDICFLITAWDCTAIGEQHLLSEALTQLLSHHGLPDQLLPATVRGHGTVAIEISAIGSSHAIALWNALGIPLRPALYVTVTIPVQVSTEASLSGNESRLQTHPMKVLDSGSRKASQGIDRNLSAMY
jgi:hypothetical protein